MKRFIYLGIVGVFLLGMMGCTSEGSLSSTRFGTSITIHILKSDNLVVYSIPRHRLNEKLLRELNEYVINGWELNIEWDSGTDNFIFIFIRKPIFVCSQTKGDLNNVG